MRKEARVTIGLFPLLQDRVIIIIIIIIIRGALGWDRLAPQPTTGTWTLPPTRVRGDTFGKCQQPQGHPR